MMVVPYRPGQRLFWLIGSILLISLGTLCGFGFGYYQIYRIEESFKNGFLEQTILLDELSAENSELKRQVAKQTSEEAAEETVEVDESIDKE